MPSMRQVPFEELVSATYVREVALAPDGEQVVYVTTPASKEGEHPVSTLWLVGAAGGPSRRLTGGEAHDYAARWSPDGRWLAFLSDRRKRGTAQLYLLPLAGHPGGGEAVRLTDHDGGVADPAWSPDGRM